MKYEYRHYASHSGEPPKIKPNERIVSMAIDAPPKGYMGMPVCVYLIEKSISFRSRIRK